jgi:hypothetical protein
MTPEHPIRSRVVVYEVWKRHPPRLLRQPNPMLEWRLEPPRVSRRLFCLSQACSGQLIPDTVLSFSSATTGAIPPLKAWGRS